MELRVELRMELRSVEELMDLPHACRGGTDAPDRHGGTPDRHSGGSLDLIDAHQDAVRPLLGRRVAHLVRLHALAPDDLVRLHAGGWVDAAPVEDVLTLRQADEVGRVRASSHHLPGA